MSSHMPALREEVGASGEVAYYELSKEMKTVDTVLREMNREKVDVGGGGNCLFLAVAHQIPYMNHITLRQLTCCHGLSNAEKFAEFMWSAEEGETTKHEQIKKFQQEINNLMVDGTWQLKAGDLVMTILSEALQRKMVVISPFFPPQMFHSSDRKVYPDTIVIVQSANQNHYYSTIVNKDDDDEICASQLQTELEPIAHRSGEDDQHLFGSNERQLRQIGVMKDKTPRDGNSIFVSISRQSKEPITPQELRELACHCIEKYAKQYAPYRKGGVEKIRDDVQKLVKDKIWIEGARPVVLLALADQLNLKIGVIEDYGDPRWYPNDRKSRDIILVYSQQGDHYDSIRKPTKKESSDESDDVETGEARKRLKL